jgi:hypothetical protein
MHLHPVANPNLNGRQKRKKSDPNPQNPMNKPKKTKDEYLSLLSGSLWLCHSSRLHICSDDWLPSSIQNSVTLLSRALLLLSNPVALPCLNFHSSTDDSNSHSTQKIMCAIGMVVHA